MKQVKISDFFNTDYVDQASYDNLRKIASFVDGQKNASRKILYTILEKNVKNEIKVSQLGAKISEFAEYLHGNLDGVIVNLAQNFTGSNNIPLLVREGNFGTRFSQEASAARYIYTHGSDEFFELFRKEDNSILVKQFFEGNPIEPKYYVPNLPLLLINGSEGVSSGFAQKILPRDPKKIKQYILNKLQGRGSHYKFEPFYQGFNGTIEQGENPAQWIIKGSVKCLNARTVLISEVPIGYDLKGYLKVLDDLEDRRAIQSYIDKSEGDVFKFEVKFLSRVLSEMTEEDLLHKLKLIKKVTENYTVVDENNRVQILENAQEIIDKYIEVKLKSLQDRKVYQIGHLEEEIRFDYSKWLFVKMIVDETLLINKRKKSQIEADLDKVKDIIQKNDSYDYLLNLPIHSLTDERLKKLDADMKTKANELKVLKKKTVQTIWEEEL